MTAVARLFVTGAGRAGVIFILALAISSPCRGTEQPAASPAVPAPAPRTGLADDIRLLRDQIAQAPGDSLLHVRLGYLLLDQGSLNEARQAFDEALKLNHRSHAAMTGKGIILARSGKLAEAEQALAEALVQNPNPVRTHYELGLVYQKMGNLEKALAEYKEGIKKFQQGRR